MGDCIAPRLLLLVAIDLHLEIEFQRVYFVLSFYRSRGGGRFRFLATRRASWIRGNEMLGTAGGLDRDDIEYFAGERLLFAKLWALLILETSCLDLCIFEICRCKYLNQFLFCLEQVGWKWKQSTVYFRLKNLHCAMHEPSRLLVLTTNLLLAKVNFKFGEPKTLNFKI